MRKLFLSLCYLAFSVSLSYAIDTDLYKQFFNYIDGHLCYSVIDNKNVELKATSLSKGQEADSVRVKVVIPDSVKFGGKSYAVKQLAEGVFRNCTVIDTVVIADGLKIIGASAFEGCVNLKSIHLPSTLTTIHEKAFSGCRSLTSIGLPYTLNFIGNSVFEKCMGITAIRIPSQVEDFGPSVFKGCDNLVAVNVDEANPYMASVDGVLYNKGLTNLICCPTARTTALVLPKTVTVVSWAFSPNMKLSCVSCYSEIPPIVKNEWPHKMPAVLFVQKRLIPFYQIDSNWNRFQIRQY